jgi:hypothetical protein
MRMKAQLRDVNLQASRKTLLADNSGKVYQKAPAPGAKPATKAQRAAGRGTEPMTAARALQQRSGQAAVKEQKRVEQKRVVQNRAMPVAAKGLPSDKGLTAAEAVKRADRGTPKLTTGAAVRTGQPQARAKATEQFGKAAAPGRAMAPVQQKAAPAQQKAAPADSRNVRQASAATGQAGSKNLGQAVRQKSYASFSAPARQAPTRAAVGQAAPRMDQAAPRMDRAAPRMDQAAPRMEKTAPPARYSAPAQPPQASSAPHYAPAHVAESRGRGESAPNGSRRGERD